MAARLWPDEPVAEHARHMRAVLASKPASTLPLVVLVAELGGAVVGFLEVGLRSHADGCDARRPVGLIEGWLVLARHRRRGVGRALVAAAERWAAAQGCTEIASDTWIDSLGSQRAHRALGFEIVDRCVNLRKRIRRKRAAPHDPDPGTTGTASGSRGGS